MVGPSLHHLAPLLNIGRVVVCAANLVCVPMRELPLDPVAVEVHLVQRGADQMPESVAGLLALVADAGEGDVDGVLAHRPLAVVAAWE